MSGSQEKPSSGQAEEECSLFTWKERSVLEVLPKADLAKLYQYLHNGNSEFDYAMGFVDRATAKVRYTKSKKVPVARAITWAIDTIATPKDKQISIVPYPTNPNGYSHWGAMDFDAHDGAAERARTFAMAAFQRCQSSHHFVVLETSGTGGWHLWLISDRLEPVSYWKLLLTAIARDINAPIQSGVCEIFPADSLNGSGRRGMRAPGSWNPKSNTCSQIVFSTVERLVPRLPPFLSGKRTYRLSESSLIEKEVSFSPHTLSDFLSIVQRDGAEFAITAPRTRHDRLKSLVGQLYFQASQKLVECAARAQYREKTPATAATQEEHMKEFKELWAGLERTWCESLPEAERTTFQALTHPTDRDAFRIVWSYNRLARERGESEFPICRDNFGARLGLTGKGGGEVILRLCEAQLIRRTQARVANVRCARYQLLVSSEDSSRGIGLL